MFGIIGESKPDAVSVQTLIRRIRGASVPIHMAGMKGGGDILKNGFKKLNMLLDLSCQSFVLCHDSDGKDPDEIRKALLARVIKRSRVVSECYCLVVPVQEIEAWILADVTCVTKKFSSWKPEEISNPERIDDPKEYLIRLSRKKTRPRYAPAVHNPQLMEYLDLEKVRRKCPSFRPLYEFIANASSANN